MSKYDELKRLAEASRVANQDERGLAEALQEALHPEVVLALIAENERLERLALDSVNAEYAGSMDLESICAERDQLRAEVAGLRTGYQAYERVNAELKAENEALRKALMDAEYRIDQGKVWTENGWMYAGLSQQGQMKALEILREATKLKLNNHSYIHQYRGPKITKPTPPNKPSEPIVRRVVNEKVINANEVKP